MYRNSSAIHLLIVLMGLLTTTSAQAQVGRRTIATIKSDNIRHVVDYGTVQFQEGKGQALLNVASAVPGIVWTFDDIIHPAPVPDSVSLSTIVNSAWVGQDLNLQRLQRFLIDGNGIPLQEIPGVFSSEVVVEAAKDADLAVWLVETSSVVVEAYNSLSNVPLWTFSVPAPFTNINNQSISVSRDGSVVCVAVRDNGPPEITRVYLLNGATGAELKHLDYANRIVSVDLVDDGSACLGKSVV